MGKADLDSKWFVRNVPRRPINLLWEITDACNLRCLHCEASAGRRSPDELTHEQALDLAHQIAAMRWRSVNITGGEPLMRRDWDELAAVVAASGAHVTLVTNGLLFDDAVIERARAAGIKSVACSLDGLEETHERIRPGPRSKPGGSFQAALRTFRVAREAGFGTAAITHFNRWNYPDLPAMHELLTELRVGAWQVQLGVPLGRLREIDEPYLIEVERLPEVEALCARLIEASRADERAPAIKVVHTIGYYGKHELTLRRGTEDKERFFVGCVGGWRVLGVTSDGMVKPCGMLPRNFGVGDLKTERLADVWGDVDRFDYQAHWDEKKLEGYCRICDYRCICRAGCTSMAYGLTGSIYNNPYCVYRLIKQGDAP